MATTVTSSGIRVQPGTRKVDQANRLVSVYLLLVLLQKNHCGIYGGLCAEYYHHLMSVHDLQPSHTGHEMDTKSHTAHFLSLENFTLPLEPK